MQRQEFIGERADVDVIARRREDIIAGRIEDESPPLLKTTLPVGITVTVAASSVIEALPIVELFVHFAIEFVVPVPETPPGSVQPVFPVPEVFV